MLLGCLVNAFANWIKPFKPLSFSGDKSAPPKLEPSDSQPPVVQSDGPLDPPTLNPVEFTSEQQRLGKPEHTEMLNGLSRDRFLMDNADVSVVATSTVAERSAPVNRRTSVLFRKSKSTSPQKATEGDEAQIGAKTILSVVIPRLETLLHTRKRTRSASRGSEGEEEMSTKRPGTAQRSAEALTQLDHNYTNRQLTQSCSVRIVFVCYRTLT